VTVDAIQHRASNTALDWSVAAMNAAADRVNRINAVGLAEAFAAIGEAVWWITVVDDNVRDRHGKAYRRATRATTPNPTDTMRGLRSARNRICHEVEVVDFIVPIGSRPDRGDGRVSAWAWQSVPRPGVMPHAISPGTQPTNPRSRARTSFTPSGWQPASCNSPKHSHETLAGLASRRPARATRGPQARGSHGQQRLLKRLAAR
jgi:hypothetical protein